MRSEVFMLARFILIPFLGWSAMKLGIAGGRARAGLGFLLVNILYPIMILANVWQTDFRQLWLQSALTVIFCAALTTFLFFAGRWYFHKKGFENPALWNFMFGIGNVAYISVPILQMFFGSAAASLGIVYSSVGDLYIWLLYYPMVLAGRRRSPREVLLNPCLITLIFSLVLSGFQVPVPRGLASVLNASTTVVSVSALFYVGLRLATARLGEIFKSRAPWLLSAFKVLALPAVCFLVLWPIAGARQAALLAVLAGSPVPLLSLVWAKEHPSSRQDAAACLIVSTLLFLIVMIPLGLLFQRLN